MAYEDKAVIHDVSLQINPGEIFGLIGLNGAGKTTLIKGILGLREYSGGPVSIFDAQAGTAKAKKQIAYLPERFEPAWFLKGMEFLKFSASLYKTDFDEKELIHEADILSLDKNVLGQKVQTYSKGMRQKLGLLGTMAAGCNLLILDEPMSGLDPKARSLVKKMILKAKQDGKTVFLCSHILSDMDEICDRIGILGNGKMIFTGTPAALKEKTNSKNLEHAFLHLIEKKQAA